jgi:glycosyltransferase involved in cell wall biosynthesis
MVSISVINAQKDDVGWTGKTPKWSKGPDILVDLLVQLRDAGFRLDITLVGPNRGYVRDQLDRSGYDYIWRHDLSERELREAYQNSQVYLCTSRVEGGPLGPFESYLCGCSVVSTDVGMVRDYSHLRGFYVAKELSASALVEKFRSAVDEGLFASVTERDLASRSSCLDALTPSYFSNKWMEVLNER